MIAVQAGEQQIGGSHQATPHVTGVSGNDDSMESMLNDDEDPSVQDAAGRRPQHEAAQVIHD